MKKMDRKKMLTYIVCVCAGIAVISFAVVMLTRPENPNGEENIKSISSSDIVENHIYHEYDASFIVDADITSTAPEKADVLYAKFYQPDEKKMWSELFNVKIPERKVSESFGHISYNDGEHILFIPKERTYFRGSQQTEYLRMLFATENFTTKYEAWGTENYINPSFDTMYNKESLSFMTRNEAIDYVYSILQKLNIEVSKEDVYVYAIDCETIQQIRDKLVTEDPDTAVNYNLKEKYTEDDELYILSFTTVRNQIPVTHSRYVLAETRTMYGSNIKVYLSENGIINFDLEGIYQVESVAESAENFITVQEALDKAYKENVLGIKLTVDEVRFEYAPIPYNSNYDEVKLTPVWTVHMNGTQVDGHALYDTMMIDAITGEKIN